VFLDRIPINARSPFRRSGDRGVAADRLFQSFAIFWCLALMLGGGGVDYPLAGMLVEAGGVILPLAMYARTASPAGARNPAAVPTAIGLAMLALPVIQLIPLPPALWQALPGRERAAEIYGLLGWRDAWLPLSLEPEATKAAALSVIPALATFLLIARTTTAQRIISARILVGIALLGALLGAVQVATGGNFTLFDSVHRGHALGFFTNRNHQALFLLIAMPFACATASIEDRRHKRFSSSSWANAGLILVLTAAVLATKSRSGAALLLVVLPFCAVQLGLFKIRLRTAAIVALAAIALLAIVASSSAVQDLVARFGNAHDDRTTFWANTLVAISQSGMLGTGFGTFPIIYRTVEPLTDLAAGYVNHAHCDYLELLLEGGLPGIGLLVAALGWIGFRASQLLRAAPVSPDRRLARAALIGILIITLHSLVDYPLRMLSLEILFGFLCALLILPAQGARPEKAKQFPSTRPRTPRLRQLLVALVAAACLYEVAVTSLASHAVINNAVSLAETLSSQSPAAASYAAKTIADKDPPRAASLARLALRHAPLDVQALSTLALAIEKRGDEQAATAMMNAAAGAGWWDDATQIWLFDRARDVGRYDIALERADALLRRERLEDALFPLLLGMAGDADAAAALVTRLEERPSWRSDFLQWADEQDSTDQQQLDRLWQMLSRSSAPPSAREATVHVAGLIKNHRYAQAKQLWLRAIGASGTQALFDGDFIRAYKPLQEGYASPFEWSFNDDPGAATAIDQPPLPYSRVAMNVTVDPGFSGTIARQLVVLPPGSYELGYAMLAVDNADPGAASWSVRCVNSEHRLDATTLSQPAGGRWGRAAVRVEVPGDCPAQWVELRGTGNALSSSELWYDRLRIFSF